jgi:hypothetical protein
MSFRCQKCNQAFITKKMLVIKEDGVEEMRAVPEKPNRVVTKWRNTDGGQQIAEEQNWCDGCVQDANT